MPGAVAPLHPGRTAQGALKVPHMGWNALDLRDSNHPLLAGFGKTPYVYFVHSFHLRPSSADHLLATVDYGGPVTAMVGRDNLAGTHDRKRGGEGKRGSGSGDCGGCRNHKTKKTNHNISSRHHI